jgi:hypothetical protein
MRPEKKQTQIEEADEKVIVAILQANEIKWNLTSKK